MEISEKERYEKAWSYLRLCQIAAFTMFVPCFLFVLMEMLTNRVPRDMNSMQAAAVLALVMGFAVSIILYTSFKCPRCGNTFFYKGIFRSLTGKTCMHCGLPRNAPFNG